MEFLGFFLALFVGVSLGLIGGGGSILAMPILVYLFRLPPQLATSYSLCIVGFSAAIGAVRHYRLNNLDKKTALVFGIPSVVSLLLVRKYAMPLVPEQIFRFGDHLVTKHFALMSVFALLMIAASVSMMLHKQGDRPEGAHRSPDRLALAGFFMGIVTGALGAGGGFLMIPALVFFAGLRMKQAIGTSLFIIAANALIGFAGDLANHVRIDFGLLSAFTLFSVVGIWTGTFLTKKIDGGKLGPAFGWFLLIAGVYILAKEYASL